jgi:uncharacterized protein YcbK (DUF882 family)
MDWGKIKHFTPNEFDDPTAVGTGSLMKEELIHMLDAARELAGVPFVIESGWRTVEHNRAVGGKPSSAHLAGEAVDIQVPNAHARWNILVALLAAGFTRFEIKPHDIHVDVANDPEHPQELIMVIMDTKTGQLV